MVTVKMDKLTSEISEKRIEVNLAFEYVENLKAELQQFSDANFNLRVQVSQEIKNDKGLSPSQILAEMERLEGLELQRLRKLENFEKTVTILNERIKTAQDDLKFAQAQLNRLEDEQNWLIEYLPEASKYQQGFIDKAVKEYNQKLNGFEYELNKWQSKAQIIERYLKHPAAKEKTCVLEPMKALGYADTVAEQPKIAVHISNLQNAIETLKENHELFILSLNINSEFRKFIRHRVDIQQAATDLERAQNEYLDKLQAFSLAKGNCRAAIAYTGNRAIDYFQMLTVTVGDKVELSLSDIEV
ncbi:chromosome segregation protein Smc (plasmid) [Nostoc sp. 'Peltigera membranacea cyanobiont' N6]|nr:chromosome segregation protein Smc [Nostoc sp. 'Peltigera membranacea cyanobiont' N6]